METGPSYGGIPRLRGIEWNRRNTYAHTTCPGDNRQIWFIRFPSFPFHASLPPFFSPSSNFKPKRFSLARFFDDDEGDGDGEGELFVRFQLKLCHFFRMINYVLSLDGFERLKCKGSLLLTIHIHLRISTMTAITASTCITNLSVYDCISVLRLECFVFIRLYFGHVQPCAARSHDGAPSIRQIRSNFNQNIIKSRPNRTI